MKHKHNWQLVQDNIDLFDRKRACFICECGIFKCKNLIKVEDEFEE
jgi:hypothetical protein